MRTGIAIYIALSAVLLAAGCTSPDNNSTGPEPVVTLSVEVQPPTIPANGISRSVVFVEMRRGDNPMADSTEVILLNSVGVLQRGIVYTHGGVALDTLASDTIAGSGWLVAYSLGLRDSVEIFFTEIE